MSAPPVTHAAAGPARLARALASPAGVLALVPLLVAAAGVAVLLVGRRATLGASDAMARRQLADQAASVQHDVAFALDQADVLLARLRPLADPALPLEVAAPRLHDLVVGRPGVTNVSLSFPTGVMRGTYQPDGVGGPVLVQESQVEGGGTRRRNYRVARGAPALASEETTTYDPRTRPHWAAATAAGRRVWLPPRTFFTSGATGLTCAEPLYDDAGALRAVATVDFDVGALSAFVARAPLEGARAVMFARDGTILAFPSRPVPAIAQRERRLLRHGDYADPALDALFAALGDGARLDPAAARWLAVSSTDGPYLASVAPVGGRRAGVAAPLDWYLATLVPARSLLGPTHRLVRDSALASGGALVVAVAVALLFAWNLVRMRRQLAASRAEARTAQARARELGSYRLVHRLGAGGMGEVWRAEHRLLARQAAIKLVRAEALADPATAARARERFRREAQTLAAMRSRHTIALHDYGATDDGTFFYVMELLDGLDLDALVRAHGPQPAARVVGLLAQACQSLAEAHAAGLLHRDIKPGNLFACRAADEVDVLKVLDFGIVHARGEPDADPVETIALVAPAAATPGTPGTPDAGVRAGSRPPTGRLTQVGLVVGTPGYIAPEQARGEAMDGRSDLYALGCVAWWLLTGAEVFPRGDGDRVLEAHLHAPVPPLRGRVPGWLPDELAALIDALLAKDPADRPADARAVLAALRAVPIPDEHAWDDARAQAWWARHRPAGQPTDAGASADAGATRVLVPRRSEDAAPAAATVAARPAGGAGRASPEARTVVERGR